MFKIDKKYLKKKKLHSSLGKVALFLAGALVGVIIYSSWIKGDNLDENFCSYYLLEDVNKDGLPEKIYYGVKPTLENKIKY